PPLDMNNWSNEETNDPLVGDAPNFYKVEKWTRDGMKIDSLMPAMALRGEGGVRARHQAPAAHPADHPPAHAGVGRVATTRDVALTRFPECKPQRILIAPWAIVGLPASYGLGGDRPGVNPPVTPQCRLRSRQPLNEPAIGQGDYHDGKTIERRWRHYFLCLF